MLFRADQLDVDRAIVLVIDLQEKLMPLVRNHERIIAAAGRLLDGAKIFDLPVIATEQYPRGLGPTVEPISARLKETSAQVFEKPTFSAWAQPQIREALIARDRTQVILIGIETHVCIQQTALDLISRDYDVFVCADAVGSRVKVDHKHALHRFRQEGGHVTTIESVLFELCHRCDTPKFKAMLEVIKQAPVETD